MLCSTLSLRNIIAALGCCAFSMFLTPVIAQKVGIGTDAPIFTLHVEGDTYTAGQLRVMGYGNFLSRVQIGIGGNYQQNYQLHVQGDSYLQNLKIGTFASLSSDKLAVGGNARIDGTLHLTGSVTADGSFFGYNVHANNLVYAPDLHITNNAFVDNDAIVSGNFRTNGRVGINGSTNASYALMVNSGNSYFQGNTTTSGNATVNGTLNATGELTIKGNGHVRSQGPSNLQVGFKAKSFNESFGSNVVKEFTITLDAFNGGNNDIRVMVSQFDADPAAAYQNWRYFSFKIYDIDALTNSCRLVVHNGSGVTATLKGVLYLTTISKE